MQDRLIRLADLVIAAAGLVALSPVMILLVFLVWADVGRPVFFRQIRLGKDGASFEMLKFRSMRDTPLADAAELKTVNEYSIKVVNDPRITKLGAFIRKTSLDELPQLINVLRGDMSIVGPRPWVPVEYANFPEEWFGRLNVKPGITGLAQIAGRSDLHMEKIIACDLEWVRNRSLGTYLLVIFKTASAIAFGKSAY